MTYHTKMQYVYPMSNCSNNVFYPFKIENSDIENTKNKLIKITKCSEPVKITQTEYYYRDLVKIVLCDGNKTTTYATKKSYASYDDNNELIISYNIKPIEPCKFPNLSKYDNVENKLIYKYDNVLLIKTNDNCWWTVCIENNTCDESLLKKIITALKK